MYRTTQKKYVSSSSIQAIVSMVLGMMKEPHAAVSVHIIGDTKMRTLNRSYRGKDATTDVLAFAAQEGQGVLPTDDRGDIFLCMPQIERQAKRYGISFREEYTRMLVHGLLHVYGYDHERSSDAKKMFELQERLVKRVTSK